MRRTYDRSFVLRYTVLGAVLGATMWTLIVLMQLFTERATFSMDLFVRLHRMYPCLYILDLLPLASALSFFLLTRTISRERRRYADLKDQNGEYLTELYNFAKSMRGGLSFEFNPHADDPLGQTLLALRNDLTETRNKDLARQEEERRHRWISTGIAQFDEILRTESKNMEELAYKLVSSLVKYVEANQCGFYLLENEEAEDVKEKYFRLTACYAYDRKKFSNQIIPWGDGLVGACAQEGVTMRLDKVPDGYMTITSGLGEATPQNLMLLPVAQDGNIFGILEIASFKPFQDSEVEFTEKVASAIASTLTSKRINIRTNELLAESRRQTEILIAQEEQMLQNMEELTTAQEEAARQADSYTSFTNSVNQTMIRAEYDLDGILLYANSRFLQKLEYSSLAEVAHKHVSTFITKKDRPAFDSIWASVVDGGRHFEGDLKHMTKTGKDLWIIATYTVLKSQGNTPDRILFLAIDITREKLKNLDRQGKVDALDRVSLSVELTPLGDVVNVNDKFTQVLGYTPSEVLRKPLVNIFPSSERKSFERILEGVCQGENFEGSLRAERSNGEECWLRASLTTVNDMYGDISRVILIANDMTREKIMEMETHRQTEQLKQQEEQLRQNEVELSKKLRQAREEVKNQFREIEKVQIRNEKTLEGFLDAIITTDQDGMVEFFNRAAEELFAIDRSEVLGQNIRLLFPPESIGGNEFLKAYLDPKADKVIGERKEVNIYTSTGEEISVLMLLSEAKLGRKLSYTAFIQNISLDLF